jgi:phage shock protein PspC (stress-responsive transcriptional regulator)
MKDIRQVSLNSVVFYVEEDGYIAIKQYIDNLERYYADKEGGKEIIEDIQIRFAELLSEKRTFTEQAITLQNIEDVIAVLGYPDNFEPEENKESKQQESPLGKKRKQLYRDLENARLAGVCSGLSYYFGIDVWIFRLAFICLGIFSVGTWILVYLILWFVIPLAKTTRQRYEMKGEALNIEDIEQRVKSGIHEAEAKVRNFASKNADNIRETANEISSSAKNIFKIIGKIFGVCFIFASVCAILVIVLAWYLPIPSSFIKIDDGISIFCVNEILPVFGLNPIASFLLLMCVLLPFILLLLSGIVFLTSELRRKMGVTILIGFMVWIVLTVFVVIGTVMFVKNIETNNTSTEKEINFSFSSQNIVIKPQPDVLFRDKGVRFFGENIFIKSENKQTKIYGIPRLDYTFKETNDSIVTVRVLKMNCNEKTMCEFQNNIKMEDSILYMPSLFNLEKGYWSGEKMYVELSVPKGTQFIVEPPFVWQKTIYADNKY